MDTVAFDALTRRASLLLVGASGLSAAFAGPLPAGAKSKSKKLKKKQQQKCQTQVEPCEAVLAGTCANDPECLATLPPCCTSLGICDVRGLFACILAAA